MKRIFLTVIAVIALFIPTYVAIYIYDSAKEAPVEQSSVYAMDLSAPDGKRYSFNSDTAEDMRMIEFFMSMNENAKSTESLPADLANSPCYTATYYSYDIETEYKYFFSKTKPSNSYYLDNKGQSFRIDASLVIKFLDSDYAASLYGSASVTPVLTVAGREILPEDMEWHYYSYSSIAHSVKTETAEETVTLDVSYADIPSSFSMLPDSAELIVKNGDNELYKGTPGAFAEGGYLESIIKASALLDATVTAVWEESHSLGCGGSAKYSFKLNCVYDPPAKFVLGESRIELEEFVVITGKHIDEIKDIRFESDPALGYTPRFIRDGEYVRALVPITSYLGLKAGRYTFTVTYGEDIAKLELEVRESSFEVRTRKYNYSGKLNVKARTEANLEEFYKFISGQKGSDDALFKGSFDFVAPDNIRAEFGDIVNNGKENEKFVSHGMALVVYTANSLTAVNDGVVIAAETTKYGGNTVIVDHGWGIKSVYYCLKTVNVTVGDKVFKGETIGSGAASTGYSDGLTAYIELWLNDTPISYYPLLEGGRTSSVAVVNN